MGFANLSPAERMKASGLIGLIVVVVFFVVHTMLGALAPKKAAAPAGAAPPAPAAATAAAPAPEAPVGDPFPVTKAAAGPVRRTVSAAGMEIEDPFVPIAKTPAKPEPGTTGPGGPAPAVEILPSNYDPHRKVGAVPPLFPPSGNPVGPVSLFGGSSGGPGAELPGLGGSPGARAAAEHDPAIRVVGIVHGEPSVATLQVDGRVVMARPREALAPGYRLMEIDPEGVTIRRRGEFVAVRVGSGLNEEKPKQ